MKNTILLLLLLFSTLLFAQPGSLDTTFNVGTGTNSYILTSLIQEDGKIFIGGAFSSYNGTASNGIARINPDGSIDTSFNIGTGIPWIVTSSALQPDGKIIIGGHFETFNGVSRNKIVRINTDGSLDLTFNPGTGAYGNVNNVLLQPDGKIIIVGDFTSFNGVARQSIARLNTDGSLDLGFNSGFGDSNIFTLSLQSDGKIIVGGYFTNIDNVPRNNIARLNSDGSLDTSFNPIGANDGILTTVIQPDGKIIIGGAFSQYNNTATNHIARLNTDGSLDTSFNSGTANGLDYYSSVIVHAITLQPDGKIIIGGEFSSYNGIERNYLLLLNKDGDLDTSFAPVEGPNNQVRTISIQSDGKLIIAGAFSEYNHTSTRFIARINNDLFAPVTTPQSFCISAVVSDLKALGIDLKWYSTEIGGTPLTLTTSLSTATYYVSQTVDGVESSRATVPVTIITPVTPTFTQPSDSCPGTVLQPLPTISNNGITGSWSPPLDNTTTTNYTFTPTVGSCATTASLTLTIKSGITPIFTQVAPICSGDIIPALPTISDNNIAGSWSPALNNLTTATYTFTPSNEACATTAAMTITVNPYTTPTFTQLAPICSGEIITALPMISNNGISGIWSPALDNTTTTEYTFTPSTAVGSCINTTKMTITVNPIITPTFTQIAPICSGSILNALPTTSNNGITGFWSPMVDNANTQTYTFTPTSGVCATTSSMTIIVNPNITPTFTQIAPICSGDIIPALPVISNNNITGSWSPTLNNTATTVYSFTPTTGSCATIVPMKIEVLPSPNIELNHNEIICSGNNELVQLNAGLLSGSESQYNYEWSRNGLSLPLETGYYLNVNQDGIYSCLVTDKTSSCTRTRTNTVIYSKEVTIENVIISDLTANNTVTIIASGLDNTEYSLDNPNGPFQLSNTFENVEPGFHIVSVKDKNGCGINSKNIAVVGAPLYFTPNNDGFNDYWKVKGINGLFFKNSKLVIYDRYGKMLKMILNAESEGWDGTYNGNPLPADDYWYVLDLEDGRSAKGHFSLKR